MKYVSRDEWGAQYAKGNAAIGDTKGVTLHWEGPHMGVFSHAECATKVRGIERFHSVNRGWAGIAYNFLVCPHGYVFEGRGIGVRSAANGWTEVNDDWYAVCYLGGEGDGVTADGKDALVDAVIYCREHGAGPRVNGHRDHKATSCPGDEIYQWLQTADFTPAKPLSRGKRIDHALRDIRGAKRVAKRKNQKGRVSILSMAQRALRKIQGK